MEIKNLSFYECKYTRIFTSAFLHNLGKLVRFEHTSNPESNDWFT